MLAVCLADGNIVMLKSFDDVSPITIQTSLKAPLHAEWSNSRELLAIAGVKESDVFQSSPQVYTNLLKFYSDTGMLVYSTTIPCTQVIKLNKNLFVFFFKYHSILICKI